MKSKLFTVVISVLVFSFQTMQAQVRADFCQKLETIIREAENGTFENIKGAKVTEYKSDSYHSTVSISRSASIFQSESKGWMYMESLTYDHEMLNAYYNAFVACLPKADWAQCNGSKGEKTGWLFKNLKSRVFVQLDESGVMLTVYLQKGSTAKCLWGNCVNGYGSYVFDNDDVYTGDYIDGTRTGKGVYTWADTGQYYDGCWLNGKMNGRGAIYKADSTLIKEGYMYQNQWMNVDVSKTPNFTMGEKVNGFGLVYDNGKYQVTTLKDAKPSEMTLVNNVNLIFGKYDTNGFAGNCIVYYPDGNAFYGYFQNNNANGKGIKYFTDGTKLDGEFTTKTAIGSKFDSNDFLVQKESWVDGKLTVDNSPATLELVKFAKSLSYICTTGVDNLRGAEIPDEVAFQRYKSKYKLLGAVSTEITTEYGSLKQFVESKINATKQTKAQALDTYNLQMSRIKSCISSAWEGKETVNKDSATDLFRIYTFTNSLYDYSFEVKSWFNDVVINVK